MTSTGLQLTGSFWYHAKALRSSWRTWKPFREELSQALERWLPDPSQPLILVGPSGGYCLKKEWLAKFPALLVIELDPLARRIFSYRYGEVRFVTEDLLMKPTLEAWHTFLNLHPGAPVLFCNLLGQLPLTIPNFIQKSERETWGRTRLEEILRALGPDRPWASFHDRLSLTLPYSVSPRTSRLSIKDWTETLDLAERAFKWARVNQRTTRLQPNISKFELAIGKHVAVDHGTEGLAALAQRPVRYYAWPLSRRRLHIIEWIEFRSTSPVQNQEGRR